MISEGRSFARDDADVVSENMEDFTLSFTHGTSSASLPGILCADGKLLPLSELEDMGMVPYTGELWGRSGGKSPLPIREIIFGVSFEDGDLDLPLLYA